MVIYNLFLVVQLILDVLSVAFSAYLRLWNEASANLLLILALAVTW